MHLPKHLLAGVTVMAMAATTAVALGATHSTTGPTVRATSEIIHPKMMPIIPPRPVSAAASIRN